MTNDSSKESIETPQNTTTTTTTTLPPVLHYFTIEGNIGAGKSTLLKILEEYFGADSVDILREPVEEWTGRHGANFLEAFYKDPKKYAYLMQTIALVTRNTIQKTPQYKRIRFTERSNLSDQCFAENCKDSGYLDPIEVTAREMWYRSLVIDNEHARNPSVIFYLRTDPQVCYERVLKRARSEESTVRIEYLQNLHEKHEKWLVSNIKGVNETAVEVFFDSIMGIPVVVLDGNSPFQDCKEARDKIIRTVNSVIKQRENQAK